MGAVPLKYQIEAGLLKKALKPSQKVLDWLKERGQDHQDIEAVRQLLRQRCKADLWFLCYHVLEMEDINTELHMDMCERWQKRRNRRYTMWLIPRGHLKTSLWTRGGTIQEFLIDPDQRALVVNAKLENAIDIIADIRSDFETRELLRWLFPEYCPDLVTKELRQRCKWGVNRIDFPCSKYAGRKEGNIQCMGVEASLVSKHYDLFIFDDPINDINSENKPYRDKVFRWYRNALQLRDSPASRVRLIGTRWHHDDTYGRLITAELKRRQAQVENGEQVKPKYLIYHRQVVEPVEAGGEEIIGLQNVKPIWPERYSKQDIEDLREENGSYIFSCQWMNMPVDDEDAVFKRGDVLVAPYYTIPDEVVNFLAIDMADEETTQGDFTVLTIASFDKAGKMYVRECHRGKFLPSEILEKTWRLCQKWSVAKCGIEVTGFQRTIYKEYKRTASELGWAIPWVPMQRGKTSKRKRILAMQPRVERGDFYVEEGIENFDHIMDEVLTYPRPVHDDILDTLADLEAIYYSAPQAAEEPEDPTIFDNYFGTLDDDEDDEFFEDGCVVNCLYAEAS